jgi:hypothetical protein
MGMKYDVKAATCITTQTEVLERTKGPKFLHYSRVGHSILRCMHRASYCNMYMNQQDAQILVISPYFSSDALRVSTL